MVIKCYKETDDILNVSCNFNGACKADISVPRALNVTTFSAYPHYYDGAFYTHKWPKSPKLCLCLWIVPATGHPAGLRANDSSILVLKMCFYNPPCRAIFKTLFPSGISYVGRMHLEMSKLCFGNGPSPWLLLVRNDIGPVFPTGSLFC